MPEPSPDPAHEAPRGTLVIILIYGLLFFVGWLALYFGVFVPRGGVR